MEQLNSELNILKSLRRRGKPPVLLSTQIRLRERLMVLLQHHSELITNQETSTTSRRRQNAVANQIANNLSQQVFLFIKK